MFSRFFIFSFLILIIATVIGVILILPEYQEIQNLKLGIEEKKTEIKNEQDYSADLKNIEDKLNQYQNQLAIVKYAIPGELSLPILYDFFQNKCSEYGLILSSISHSVKLPSTDEGALQITEVDINLSVMGSYSSFKNFLSGLEKSAKIFEVENFSFSSPKDEKEPFDFSILIKTYFK